MMQSESEAARINTVDLEVHHWTLLISVLRYQLEFTPSPTLTIPKYVLQYSIIQDLHVLNMDLLKFINYFNVKTTPHAHQNMHAEKN